MNYTLDRISIFPKEKICFIMKQEKNTFIFWLYNTFPDQTKQWDRE